MSDLDVFQSQDFTSDYRLRALFSMIPRGGSVLDVGSGNGAFAAILRSTYDRFVLADHSETLVANLRKQFSGRSDVSVLVRDARYLEFDSVFDVVVATDIIEHIEEDIACLQAFHRALKKGGRLFVSVPAHPSLYGLRDTMYGHIRRYTKKELRSKLLALGFEIDRLRYWNAIGVVPYIISEKIFGKPLKGPARSGAKDGLGCLVNRILFGVLYAETFIPLPFGLSLIAVCKKKA